MGHSCDVGSPDFFEILILLGKALFSKEEEVVGVLEIEDRGAGLLYDVASLKVATSLN